MNVQNTIGVNKWKKPTWGWTTLVELNTFCFMWATRTDETQYQYDAATSLIPKQVTSTDFFKLYAPEKSHREVKSSKAAGALQGRGKGMACYIHSFNAFPWQRQVRTESSSANMADSLDSPIVQTHLTSELQTHDDRCVATVYTLKMHKNLVHGVQFLSS